MNTKKQTQVTFLCNPKLKDLTIKKAKEEGITLKALLTMAMRSYFNGDLSLSLKPVNEDYDEVFSDKDIIVKANKLGDLLKKTNI